MIFPARYPDAVLLYATPRTPSHGLSPEPVPRSFFPRSRARHNWCPPASHHPRASLAVCVSPIMSGPVYFGVPRRATRRTGFGSRQSTQVCSVTWFSCPQLGQIQIGLSLIFLVASRKGAGYNVPPALREHVAALTGTRSRHQPTSCAMLGARTPTTECDAIASAGPCRVGQGLGRHMVRGTSY